MLKKLLLILLLVQMVVVMSPVSALAEEMSDGAANQLMDETLNDMIVVTGTGFAGAILGLSTLSFYEHPSEHMRNITVGGAIGIIVGVGIVAFTRATKSKDMYYDAASLKIDDLHDGSFASVDRRYWHNENHSRFNENSLMPQLSYITSF